MIHEYQVFQVFTDYMLESSAKFDNLDDALQALHRMQELYGQHGKKFVLRYRTISDWIELIDNG